MSDTPFLYKSILSPCQNVLLNLLLKYIITSEYVKKYIPNDRATIYEILWKAHKNGETHNKNQSKKKNSSSKIKYYKIHQLAYKKDILDKILMKDIEFKRIENFKYLEELEETFICYVLLNGILDMQINDKTKQTLIDLIVIRNKYNHERYIEAELNVEVNHHKQYLQSILSHEEKIFPLSLSILDNLKQKLKLNFTSKSDCDLLDESLWNCYIDKFKCDNILEMLRKKLLLQEKSHINFVGKRKCGKSSLMKCLYHKLLSQEDNFVFFISEWKDATLVENIELYLKSLSGGFVDYNNLKKLVEENLTVFLIDLNFVPDTIDDLSNIYRNAKFVFTSHYENSERHILHVKFNEVDTAEKLREKFEYDDFKSNFWMYEKDFIPKFPFQLGLFLQYLEKNDASTFLGYADYLVQHAKCAKKECGGRSFAEKVYAKFHKLNDGESVEKTDFAVECDCFLVHGSASCWKMSKIWNSYFSAKYISEISTKTLILDTDELTFLFICYFWTLKSDLSKHVHRIVDFLWKQTSKNKKFCKWNLFIQLHEICIGQEEVLVEIFTQCVKKAERLKFDIDKHRLTKERVTTLAMYLKQANYDDLQIYIYCKVNSLKQFRYMIYNMLEKSFMANKCYLHIYLTNRDALFINDSRKEYKLDLHLILTAISKLPKRFVVAYYYGAICDENNCGSVLHNMNQADVVSNSLDSSVLNVSPNMNHLKVCIKDCNNISTNLIPSQKEEEPRNHNCYVSVDLDGQEDIENLFNMFQCVNHLSLSKFNNLFNKLLSLNSLQKLTLNCRKSNVCDIMNTLKVAHFNPNFNSITLKDTYNIGEHIDILKELWKGINFRLILPDTQLQLKDMANLLSLEQFNGSPLPLIERLSAKERETLKAHKLPGKKELIVLSFVEKSKYDFKGDDFALLLKMLAYVYNNKDLETFSFIMDVDDNSIDSKIILRKDVCGEIRIHTPVTVDDDSVVSIIEPFLPEICLAQRIVLCDSRLGLSGVNELIKLLVTRKNYSYSLQVFSSKSYEEFGCNESNFCTLLRKDAKISDFYYKAPEKHSIRKQKNGTIRLNNKVLP